jgi:ribosomal protein S18 acetylase RimI-like enzyme
MHRLPTDVASRPRIVGLGDVSPAALEEIWQQQADWWRARLRWDISDALAVLRRVVARRGVPGKAVQVGARTVGYSVYVIGGHRGEIADLCVLPEWSHAEVGEPLLRETIAAMRQQGVLRVEKLAPGIDYPWLTPAFEREGFQTYWREFLRIELCQGPVLPPAPPAVHLEPWQGHQVHQAAVLMQAAYVGSVDAEINALYRTAAGCQLVLDNLLNQGGCGSLIPGASALAHHQGQGVGFIVVTEIAPRQSHLAQVVVLPAYQRRGVGRWLLHYSMSQLAALHYETLSLIVSRANARALTMYQAAGLQPVLAFPVFVWEGAKG